MILWIKHNWIKFSIALIAFIICLIEAQGKGDFYIFLSASSDVFKGVNIYTKTYLEWYYHYYYDISFALLIYPLKFLPLYWAKVIWLLVNVLFTFRIWKIISFYLPTTSFQENKKRLFTIVSFVFIFSLWIKNIHLSQMTIFILYLSLEGVFQIHNKKIVLGSLLIAIGITIKILPLLLIPYLIYRKEFKASFFILFNVVLLLILPSVIIGLDYNLFLLQERWKIINPLNNEHILDISERSFHSITTLLSVLLIENTSSPFSLNLKRNIANVNLETLKWIITTFRLFFIVLSLYFLSSLPFKPAKNKLQSFYELSYILMIIPLIFPHQQHYAFFFAFPAIVYILYFFFKENIMYSIPSKKISIILFLTLIYFLLNSHFILGDFRDYYDHYKTLTYGILLLIPLLAFFKPNKLE